jgi:hypothetical protein
MSDWLPGLFGVVAIAAAFVVFIGFVGTRRLLLSPVPTTPFSAVLEGWRAVFGVIGVWRWVAVLGFAVRLFQILAYSARSMMVGASPAARFWTGVAIDSIFTLLWAAVALQISLFVLTPELSRIDVRRRTRRAIVYALIFWSIGFLFTIAATFWFALVQGRSRVVIAAAVVYLPYLLIVLAALTRSAIAVGLPRPFKEGRRILGENWFGIAVTLALAILPLSLLFYLVDLARQILHLRLAWALLIEIPIASASALCYAAFEGAIAAMYSRIG